jgi:hypothetical protein
MRCGPTLSRSDDLLGTAAPNPVLLCRAVLQHMLESEQLGPEQLGYDRPSSKLLAFLRKHYNLASYVPQPNSVRDSRQTCPRTVPAQPHACAAASWMHELCSGPACKEQQKHLHDSSVLTLVAMLSCLCSMLPVAVCAV